MKINKGESYTPVGSYGFTLLITVGVLTRFFLNASRLHVNIIRV